MDTVAEMIVVASLSKLQKDVNIVNPERFAVISTLFQKKKNLNLKKRFLFLKIVFEFVHIVAIIRL